VKKRGLIDSNQDSSKRVSNQLVSLASREQNNTSLKWRCVPSCSKVSNQLVSLASREHFSQVSTINNIVCSFQSISFPSE
jgi:hypothetical protein